MHSQLRRGVIYQASGYQVSGAQHSQISVVATIETWAVTNCKRSPVPASPPARGKRDSLARTQDGRGKLLFRRLARPCRSSDHKKLIYPWEMETEKGRRGRGLARSAARLEWLVRRLCSRLHAIRPPEVYHFKDVPRNKFISSLPRVSSDSRPSLSK